MQSTNSVKKKQISTSMTLQETNVIMQLFISFNYSVKSTNSTKKWHITCWIEQLRQSFNVIPFTFQIIVNTDVVAILLFSTTSSLFNVNNNKWNKLWRFFQRPIVVELRQHVLNSGERVRKLTVIKSLNCLLDPLKKGWCQSFIVSHHLIILTARVKLLATTSAQHDKGSQQHTIYSL